MEVVKIEDIFYAEKTSNKLYDKLEIDITDFYLGGGVKYTTDSMFKLFKYLIDNKWEMSDTLHIEHNDVHDVTLVVIRKK